MRWINMAVILLCLGQTETVQVFVGGEHVVVRTMPVEYAHDSGGWGDAAMECYTDDELYCSCDVTIVLHCCSADLDQDGDVDLADFQEMQIRWTGPK